MRPLLHYPRLPFVFLLLSPCRPSLAEAIPPLSFHKYHPLAFPFLPGFLAPPPFPRPDLRHCFSPVDPAVSVSTHANFVDLASMNCRARMPDERLGIYRPRLSGRETLADDRLACCPVVSDPWTRLAYLGDEKSARDAAGPSPGVRVLQSKRVINR